MTIKLYNTLTKKKEDFKPLNEKSIGMYVCGPTVYDRAHIGNARAVVVFDVLYRVLRQEYGINHVKYVRNITDVDDKINAAAKSRGIEISELTTATTKMFHDDMAALNCLPPDIEPRATDHIDGMIEMCLTLIKNGNAYEADGHVLFSVASDPKYGHLSRRSRDEMIAGARVEIAPYKKDPADFVLWKPSSLDEPGWDSPWGHGRPGWHIECSVMSTQYLGETFDIHGGGADLQFPHHENEIAQSCCAYPGSEFARYWVHNGFLSVEGEKMSKSLGNFVTVNDLLEMGVKGEVIRYALLATHYKKPLDWSEKAMHDAYIALDKLYKSLQIVNGLSIDNVDNDPNISVVLDNCKSRFIGALLDDLNTSLAMTELHQLNSLLLQFNKNDKFNSNDIVLIKNTLSIIHNLIGICQQTPEEWFADKNADIDDSVQLLINQRNAARTVKNWAESDRIRDELAAQGIILKDNPDGTTSWERK